MKDDLDKELDLLLRGHMATARRDAASAIAQPSGSGGAPSHGERAASLAAPTAVAHLDVDELNAYAENALPAATRARYMAHLADCDGCRRIATGLVLAAGVAGELEKRAAVPGREAATVTSWRERLAAIFAPRVLGYVAPVLAVLLVGVVGFVTLRQNSDLSPVANRVETSGESPNAAPRQPDAAEMKQSAPPSLSASPTSSPSSSPVQTTSNEVAKSNQPTANTAPGVAGAVAGGDSSETGGSGRAAQPLAQPETLAAPPPPPAVAKRAGPSDASSPEDSATNQRGEFSTSANQQRDAAQNSATTSEQEYGRGETSNRATQSTRARSDTGDDDSSQRGGQRAESRSRAASPAERSSEEAGAVMSEAPAPRASDERERRQPSREERRQSVAKPKKEDRAADDATGDETRTVAGRRFRRQSGVWVDTAFNNARALIDVRRGSEQFRALVADEQGLRSIANQLSGEVIVVWKNRAYRIR